MTMTLYDALREIPDRRGRQGRRIPLPAILALSVAATLAGADTLISIFCWGRRLETRITATRATDAARGLPEGQPGLARARRTLPTSVRTQWSRTTDQHTRSHVLRLREGAQHADRSHAEAICDAVRHWVPAARNAVEDDCLNAVPFSGKGIECPRWLHSKVLTLEPGGMSKGSGATIWIQIDPSKRPPRMASRGMRNRGDWFCERS